MYLFSYLHTCYGKKIFRTITILLQALMTSHCVMDRVQTPFWIRIFMASLASSHPRSSVEASFPYVFSPAQWTFWISYNKHACSVLMVSLMILDHLLYSTFSSSGEELCLRDLFSGSLLPLKLPWTRDFYCIYHTCWCLVIFNWSFFLDYILLSDVHKFFLLNKIVTYWKAIIKYPIGSTLKMQSSKNSINTSLFRVFFRNYQCSLLLHTPPQLWKLTLLMWREVEMERFWNSFIDWNENTVKMLVIKFHHVPALQRSHVNKITNQYFIS